MRIATLAAAVLLACAACSRRGAALYSDRDGLFTVEVPGAWRVLGPDGARRAIFFAPAAAGAEPASISVFFYAKETAQGRDADAFAAAHRGSGEALGPIAESTASGSRVLRYAVRLQERRGPIREEAAVFAGPRGLVVVLFDARESDAPAARPGFERFLAALRL
jgi:hypothetical protein